MEMLTGRAAGTGARGAAGVGADLASTCTDRASFDAEEASGVRGEGEKVVDMASKVGSRKLNIDDCEGAAVGAATGVSMTMTGVGVACEGAPPSITAAAAAVTGLAAGAGYLEPPVKKLLTAPNTP
jgi:hypothetical protein